MPADVPATIATLPGGWTLVWADEFDGDGVDAARWNVRDGESNANEASYLQEANVAQRDGLLSITAQRERVGDREFTSGYLDTVGLTGFGPVARVEVRALVPTQPGASDGLWPAVWLRSDRTSAEIDVAEWYGSPHPERPDTHRAVAHTVHQSSSGVGARSSRTWLLPAANLPSDSFHTYAVEVLPDRVVFFVDDVRTHTVTVAEHPWLTDHLTGTWNLRLNLQVGRGGSWAGAPTGSTHFPAQFVVDHVRVYER